MFKKLFTVLAFLVASVLITAVIVSVALAGSFAKPDPKAKFLKLVRENVSSGHWSDTQLVELAKASCAALESGSSIREITYLIATNDAVDSSQIEPISSVIGYGISAYCPELGDKKMKEYSGRNS